MSLVFRSCSRCCVSEIVNGSTPLDASSLKRGSRPLSTWHVSLVFWLHSFTDSVFLWIRFVLVPWASEKNGGANTMSEKIMPERFRLRRSGPPENRPINSAVSRQFVFSSLMKARIDALLRYNLIRLLYTRFQLHGDWQRHSPFTQIHKFSGFECTSII